MAFSNPFTVTLIPKAERSDWMAGMDLPWPHRALLMWTPIDEDDIGIDPRLRRALWRSVGSGRSCDWTTRAKSEFLRVLFEWVLGQPGRAQFEMRWSPDAAVFDALLDESLFFAASLDADAPRPTAEDLAFWHDQGDPPEHLFAPGQRIAIRSGVDGFCLGVFCSDAAEFNAFEQALTRAVEIEGGTVRFGSEPARA